MKSRFIIIYLLMIVTALVYSALNKNIAPAIKPLAQLPQVFGEWRMLRQGEFSRDVIDVLKPTDYLSRSYIDGNGNVVRLYIGFHDGSDQSGPIHSPKHCLPGGGWDKVSEDKLQVATGNAKLNLIKGLYQKGRERELFLYWFQIREKSVTSEYELKLVQLFNSLSNNRRDATFVRISVPVTIDAKLSSNIASKFIADFYPIFAEFVPL